MIRLLVVGGVLVCIASTEGVWMSLLMASQFTDCCVNYYHIWHVKFRIEYLVQENGHRQVSRGIARPLL